MCWLINYINRTIRVILDIFVRVIGLLYPSNQRYLPPITDRLLLEPAIDLVNRIKTGRVLHSFQYFISILTLMYMNL